MSGFWGVVDWESTVGAETGPAPGSVRADKTNSVGWLSDRTGSFRVGLIQDRGTPPARLPDIVQSVIALVDGSVANGGEIAATLGIMRDDVSDSALIASLYAAVGVGGLVRLAGSFSAVIIDMQRCEVLLAANRLGSRPVYWSAAGSRLWFASKLDVAVGLKSCPVSLEPRAVADYVTFGFVTRNCSLAAGIQLVGPGAVVRWDRNGIARVEVYATPVNLFIRREESHASYTSRVVDAFGAAVRRAVPSRGALGIALSGGLDSRAILSALGAVAESTSSYTIGVSGCADEAVAARLAKIAGTKHTFHQLDSGYLKDFLGQLRAMVSLTDGMYLSHGLTEMLALHFLRSASFEVLLRGHCGELAKTSLAWPFHTDATVYSLKSVGELIEHLLARFRYVTGDTSWLDAFTKRWRAQLQGAARASLEEILRDVPLSPPELCAYVYLCEHHRRFTTPSIELFRSAVEVRLPFADEEFLAVLLSGPPEWRDGTALHRAIIEHYAPRLLRVRDSNTGAPIDAGRLRGVISDKLNSLFKRLNVAGFRHYHNFDAWMHRMLVGAVESELLAERSLDRGMLQRDRLRNIIDGARRGERGYAYLLQVLLIIEIWQQQNVDRDQAP
jgi:asparagine synthase (glutamine-hydrolysing)